MSFLSEVLFGMVGLMIGWFIPESAVGLLKRRGIQVNPPSFILKVMVTVLTLMAVLITLLAFPNWYDRILSICFWELLLILSLTDLWSFLLLDILTYGGMILILGIRIFHPEPILSYLLAAGITGVIVAIFAIVTKGIGLGDAKLLALSALVLGGTGVLVAFWLATFFGLLYAIIDAWQTKSWSRKKRFPFGPHLAAGSFIAWCWGEQIWEGIQRIL
ncbi:prepilin peptidase [Risungbinella massiliensis]|uniref:prepilin peptidase n=1 Tax=Risungbinella massiliensis TaxID=1329796 RepID=UPI0005CC61DC|nr:A24 family peptidase [Risungbinella massiliensis]